MVKKHFLKIISLICTLCLLCSLFSCVLFVSAEEPVASSNNEQKLTYITLQDLGISNGSTTTVAGTYAPGFDNTVLSFYDTTSGTATPRIHFGTGAKNAREGIGLYFDYNPSKQILISGNYGFGGDNNNKLTFGNVVISPSTLELECFNGTKILYQFKTQFVALDSDNVKNDIRFTLYMNKKQVSVVEIKDQAEKLGNRIWLGDGTHVLQGYRELETAPENDFHFWTYNDVGTDGDITGLTATKSLGGSLDKTVFRAKINFPTTSFGTLYIGGGDWYGFYFQASGDSDLTLHCIADVDTALCTIKSSDAGVTLRGNSDLEIALSVEYKNVNIANGTTDLKVGVWINGKLYNGTYYTKTAAKLSRLVMRLHGQQVNGITVTSVTDYPHQYTLPTDFAEYTLSDTCPTFATPNNNTGNFDGSLPIDSMDKVLYSVKAKFGSASQYHFANTGSSGYGGITLHPSNGKLVIEKVAGNVPVISLSVDPQIAIGADTFVNNEFLLQFTTEYVDADFDGNKDDLKIGYWFNGTLYKNQFYYYVDAVPYLGTRINGNEGAPAVASYYESVPAECDRNWTFSNVNIPNKTFGSGWNQSIIGGESLDNSYFSGYATFTAGEQYILFGSSKSYNGFGFRILNDQSIAFTLSCSGGNSFPSYFSMNASEFGLTGFFNQKIKLGMATKLLKNYGDGNILIEAIPTINDQLYQNKGWILKIASKYFTESMVIINGVTVESTEMPSPEVPVDLKQLYLNDFGISGTKTNWAGNGFYPDGFVNTVTSLNVNFGTGLGRLHFGAQGTSGFSGLCLYRSGDNLVLGVDNESSPLFSKMGGYSPITITPSSVGLTSFANTELAIDFVINAVDMDFDGENDDLKVGVFVNGKLAKNSYVCGFDAVSSLGKGFNVNNAAVAKIYSDDANTVEYTEDGYTKYTLIDAGMSDGRGGSYGKLKNSVKENIYGTDYDKVMFGAMVKFNTVGGRLHYAAADDSDFSGVQLRLKDDGTLILEKYSESGKLSYNSMIIYPSQFGFDTFKNTVFKLQITTDIIDLDGTADDVRLGIWINGQLANNTYTYIVNQASVLGCGINFCEASDTEFYSLWDIAAPVGENEYYYMVSDENPYLVVSDNLTDGKDRTFLNGEAVTVSGDFTANYFATNTYDTVILWKPFDVHADGIYNILDLVAIKKAISGIQTETLAGQMAASKLQSALDLVSFRKYLLTNDSAFITTEYVNSVYYNQDAQGKVMPIGSWIAPSTWNGSKDGVYYSDYGMETNFLQEKYFDMIEELGINLLTQCEKDYNSLSKNDVLKCLSLAEQYNINMYVTDSGILDNITSAADLAARLNEYSAYGSFAGIHVTDEPKTSYFYQDTSNKTIDAIMNKTSLLNGFANLIGYVNLFPGYKSITGSYVRYLDEYIAKCNPKTLSFDYYPFSVGDSIESCNHYFGNLSVIREKALANNLSFMGCIGTGEDYTQAAIYTNDELPTAEQLAWNVNTMLAYGAKGYNWFTLIQPWYFALEGDGSVEGMDFDRCGLIGANGEPTRNYSAAKEINAWTGVVDSVLMDSESIDVLAKGTYAQSNTGITGSNYGDMSFTVSDETYGAIVGVFNYNGSKAYYVVNNNVNKSQDITLNFTNAHNLTVIENNANGQSQKNANTVTLNIDAGKAALVIAD